MAFSEADFAPFESYIKQKYPNADLKRFANGYANFHMQSLWDLYLHFTAPPAFNEGDFDKVFKNV